MTFTASGPLILEEDGGQDADSVITDQAHFLILFFMVTGDYVSTLATSVKCLLIMALASHEYIVCLKEFNIEYSDMFRHSKVFK